MRIAHTMLRVKDLDKSRTFYTGVLGMKELSYREFPEGEFTLVFLGYGDRDTTHTLELTYNWDGRAYDTGTGYGHLAIEVEDIYAACEVFELKGGNVVRKPGPMKHGSSPIAFVEDPDGYKIEIIQQK